MTEPRAETRQYTSKDVRLQSPFSAENPIIEREIPDIAGITDTHYQTNQWSVMKQDAISNGKGDFLGLAKFKWFRNQYRKLSQMNQVALHAARKNVEGALQKADLLIHGGDVTDSMTLFGILGDMAYHENYLNNRLSRSNTRSKKDGFLGTIVMNGNHDTDFKSPDRVLRYNTFAARLPHMSLDTYQKMLAHIEEGGSMSELFARLDETPEDFKRHVIAPGLRWYMLRKYYGSAIGAIVDTKKNQQVVFLDSELLDDSGSPDSLKKSLVKDVALDKAAPALLDDIVALRTREAAVQQDLMARIFATCESMKTVVYAHDPIKMQQQLIEYYRQVTGEGKEWATQFVEENIVIWGGHWHVNDDRSAKKWNKPGVRWWNGASRIDKPLTAYVPRGQKREGNPFAVDFLPADYMSVLTGNAMEPELIRVEGNEINSERERLYGVARILKTVKNLYARVDVQNSQETSLE